MKKNKLLSLLASAAMVTSLVTLPTNVSAEVGDGYFVSGIYGSANGWNANAAWVGFKLDEPVDLKGEADIQIAYEYLEDGEVKDVLSTKTNTPYVKTDAWAGYLTDGTNKYSDSALNGSDDKSVIPANTLIQTNLSTGTIDNLDVTQKIKEGKVSKVRTVVYISDGNGLGEVRHTNWVEYSKDLTNSIPRGVGKEFDTSKYDNSDTVATIEDRQFITVEKAVSELKSGDTLTLVNDVEVDKMLEISTNDVTLDLNGFTITASEKFKYNESNKSVNHLVQIGGHADGVGVKGVTIKNGWLKTTGENRNALNVYCSENVVLEDLFLNHQDSQGGAPLVVNDSNVTVKGFLEILTGEKSWYGVNVDKGEASLKFAKGSTLSFNDEAKAFIDTENNASITSESAKIIFDSKVVTDAKGVKHTVYTLHRHTVKRVERVEPTLEKEGNIECWYCDVCGRYYADEKLEKEIKKADTIIAKLEKGKEETRVPEIDPTKPVEKVTVGVVVDKETKEVLFASTPKEVQDKIDAKIAAGEKVTTEVVVKNVDAKQVGTDAAKVDALVKKNNLTIAQYLDLSIVVKTDNEVLGNIRETTGKLTFQIAVPKELAKEGRVFTVVRVHNGVAEELKTTVKDGIITFETDKFSTYALVYKDTSTVTPPAEEKPTTPPTTPEKPNDKVDTSDTNSTAIYVVAMGMAVLAAGVVVLNKKKEELMK